MPKRVNTLTSKIIKKKIKLKFILYADLESILVLEVNGKQNSEKTYTNKYQKKKKKKKKCNYGYT